MAGEIPTRVVETVALIFEVIGRAEAVIICCRADPTTPSLYSITSGDNR
jgi:hypothetical protein